MDENDIFDAIKRLVDEERELRADTPQDELRPDERARLDEIESRLDQLWDLMRQRRGLEHRGDDPDLAQPRDPNVVRRYQQ